MTIYEKLELLFWYLEAGLVGDRYESIDNLQNKIHRIMDKLDLELYISDLEDITNDDYNYSDYNLLCEIRELNGDVVGYLDVYYLKDRNNGLYITEINVEVE